MFRLFEIEALVSIAEHCQLHETLHVNNWLDELLRLLGELRRQGSRPPCICHQHPSSCLRPSIVFQSLCSAAIFVFVLSTRHGLHAAVMGVPHSDDGHAGTPSNGVSRHLLPDFVTPETFSRLMGQMSSFSQVRRKMCGHDQLICYVCASVHIPGGGSLPVRARPDRTGSERPSLGLSLLSLDITDLSTDRIIVPSSLIGQPSSADKVLPGQGVGVAPQSGHRDGRFCSPGGSRMPRDDSGTLECGLLDIGQVWLQVSPIRPIKYCSCRMAKGMLSVC